MARTALSMAVLALLATATFAQNSNVNVKAPAGTNVQTQTNKPGGTTTKVNAPAAAVVATPAGAAVKAPGTTAVGNKQGTVVNAPTTRVVTDNKTGATSVSTPGANVNVKPGASGTVQTPVGPITFPTGRKLQQVAVNVPTTSVATDNGATSVNAPAANVNVVPGDSGSVNTPAGLVTFLAGRKLKQVAVDAPTTSVYTDNGATSVNAPGADVNIVPGAGGTVAYPVGVASFPTGRKLL